MNIRYNNWKEVVLFCGILSCLVSLVGNAKSYRQNPYEPQLSSYDNDTLWDEAGNNTEMFIQFQNIIMKH